MLKENSYKKELIGKLRQDIIDARKEVNRNPSKGQIEAGNYALGHVTVHGYDISIENPKGSVRRGVDKDGKKWSIRMNNDYGYFRSTLGYDGDAIDVFIGDDLKSDKIFVIDQILGGKFDESKVMLGFNSEKEAMKAYLSNYEKGWSAGKHITEVTDEIFREWLYDGYKQRKPFYQYKKIKQEKLNEYKYQFIKKIIEESKRSKAYPNMNIELRKGGRNAVKMSIEDFKNVIDEFSKKFAMHEDSISTYHNKPSNVLTLASPWGKNKNVPYLKKLYSDIWEDKYKFNGENFDTRGDVKITKSGVPYIECYAGGDWECPVYVFIYFDGKDLRGYVPLKGNALCPATHGAFGNNNDGEDSEEIKWLMKEIGVHSMEDLPLKSNDIDYNVKACLEDFEERLSVKGVYHFTPNEKLNADFDKFYKAKKAEEKSRKERQENNDSHIKPPTNPLNEAHKKIRYNDKGEKVPETCPKCGSKIGLYIKGEAVYLCSNEKCGKYFGTLPLKHHKKKK